jgi:hypothetical protein
MSARDKARTAKNQSAKLRRDMARAIKLRRVSDAEFAQEADRRGYVKARHTLVPMPRDLLTDYAKQLSVHGMCMIKEPRQAVNDLNVVRAMVNTAEWIRTFIEIHDGDLAARGIEVES